MAIRFIPIPTETVRALQAGGPDANGQRPERRTSDGVGVPCRHCLSPVPAGRDYLVLAHRPFPALQPYAECGPIFLCADPCAAGGGAELPDMLAAPQYIVRGYGADDRIVYGTGGVVATPAIPDRCEELLARDDVAYVHVRSAANNCYQLRVESA
ncbi:DUF1203 domain-containing protein [Acidimangrovimonas pyrenivorans]|uniref:DUF1203 domain-containing protein n=1 Tax=Acidimangrovimonas pyrenivorans TaxID=2030798 RepID=A0ABV7AL28_9RHOB